MSDASRVDAGRRRAAAAKRAVALTAASGFVAALVLARQTSPGVAASSNKTSLVPPAGLSSEVNQGLSLGGGSIGSSSGGGSGAPAPQVQSSSS